MKRRGLLGGGWRRTAASSTVLLATLAIAPIATMAPLPVAAAAPASPQPATAASAALAGKPELATYAGAPAVGKPTDVAQQPFGLAVSGRYTFVADPVNHLVRLLIGNSEVTFAGNGAFAAEGDGSDLSRSQLVGPYAVAIGHVSQQGFQVTGFDVYIADTFAHQIRKVKVKLPPINSPSGTQTVSISTLAGGKTFGSIGDSTTPSPASAALLNSPYGLAWDDNRQVLYVADTLNNRIRAIHDPVPPDPTVTPPPPTPPLPAPDISNVVAKTSDNPAPLNHPRGLAMDSKGRLFIADTGNNLVRIYDPKSSAMTTFAGTRGAAGYSGDNHPATAAQLLQPADIAVDSAGNVYIADTGNNVIREVGTDGLIHTVAGTGKAGKFGDGGPAMLAQLSSPMAVAIRPNGDLVIGDTGNNQVRVLEGTLTGPTRNIHLEAGNGTPSFAGDGQPPATAQLSSPAAVLSQLAAPNTSVGNQPDGSPPNAAVPAVVGTRYVLDTFNQTLRTYTTADTDPDNHTTADHDADDLSTLAGQGGVRGLPPAPTASASNPAQSLTDARLSNPMGMTFDASGTKVYVADTFNNVVRLIDIKANTITTVAGIPGVAGYSGDGKAATKATLSYPTGVAVDQAGDLFIADSYNGVIREVAAGTQQISTVAGTGRNGFSGDGGPATQAGLYFPYGITVDTAASPNLYITDSFDHRVRRVDGASHVISTIAGDGNDATVTAAPTPPTVGALAAEFARPWGTTLDQGTVIVADYLNNQVRRIDPTAGTVTTIGGTGSAGLNNPGPAPAPDDGPAATGEVNSPRGLSMLGDSGALLLADSFNNRVRWLGVTQAGIQRTEVNFDPTNMAGSSQPQSVTVTSTGSGLLVMGAVDLGAANRNDFTLDPAKNSCALSRLEPGASCSFDVTFQPRAPGNRDGTVVIPDDATGGTQDVRLKGFATAALVTFSPPAVVINQPENAPAPPSSVTLTNNGTGLLHIRSVAVSGDPSFSQSNNCPSVMQPQGSCVIQITMTQISAGAASPSGTLTVRDDAAGNLPDSTGNSGSAQSIPITGGVAHSLAGFSPLNLTFTQNIGSPSPSQAVVLSNGGQLPLHLSAIREDGDFVQSNNCPTALAPGANCVISVTFTPSVTGERDGYIVVADDANDSPQRIPVLGVATMARANLAPQSLSFSQNVGAVSGAQTVNLANTGDGPMTIASIAATGDFRAVPHCPSVLGPGQACSIGVAFAPSAQGVRNGSLLVVDDANAIPGTQESIALSGFGHQPLAALSTGSLAPSANVGTAAGAQSVTVTNTGDGALTIRGVAISGPGAGEYSQGNNCVRTLNPGQSCAITVGFSPRAYGVRTASLTLFDDGPAGAQSVALRGSGTAPRPVLSSPFINFGGASVGSSSAPHTVILFNAGTGPLAISGLAVTAGAGDFSASSGCGNALASGASCVISVIFTPASPGPRSGVITVSGSGGTQRITLSGVGT